MLPMLPHDKANHAIYGAALSLAGALVAHAAQLPMWQGAIAFAAVFAVGKEAYDRLSKQGTPDPLDVVATLAGAVPAAVVGWLA